MYSNNKQYPSPTYQAPYATSPPYNDMPYTLPHHQTRPPQYYETYPPEYHQSHPPQYYETYPPQYHQSQPPQNPPTQQGASQQNMSSLNVSSGEDPNAELCFTEKTIRLNFIRKVYGILTVQLLIAVVFVSVFTFEKNLRKYVATHNILTLVAVAIVIVLIIVMACCSSVRGTTPMNYICLFVFTIGVSFLVALATSSSFSQKEVMLAIGMTAAVTLALSIFASQTKIDFTKWGGALFALLAILIMCGIFYIFFPSRYMETILAGFSTLIMSLYIIYDTQKLIGGKHRYSLSPEEYIFAALNLYLDIIYLFISILALLVLRRTRCHC